MQTPKNLKAIRGLFILTIAFLLASRACSAQFLKVAKGFVTPYDSSVVIDLPAYRMAYHRVELGDNILKRLQSRIDSLNLQVQLMSNFEEGLNRVIDKQEKIIQQNDKAFHQLDENFNKLYAIVNRPKKWYERKGVLIFFGAASYYAIKQL